MLPRITGRHLYCQSKHKNTANCSLNPSSALKPTFYQLYRVCLPSLSLWTIWKLIYFENFGVMLVLSHVLALPVRSWGIASAHIKGVLDWASLSGSIHFGEAMGRNNEGQRFKDKEAQPWTSGGLIAFSVHSVRGLSLPFCVSLHAIHW